MACTLRIFRLFWVSFSFRSLDWTRHQNTHTHTKWILNLKSTKPATPSGRNTNRSSPKPTSPKRKMTSEGRRRLLSDTRSRRLNLISTRNSRLKAQTMGAIGRTGQRPQPRGQRRQAHIHPGHQPVQRRYPASYGSSAGNGLTTSYGFETQNTCCCVSPSHLVRGSSKIQTLLRFQVRQLLSSRCTRLVTTIGRNTRRPTTSRTKTKRRVRGKL